MAIKATTSDHVNSLMFFLIDSFSKNKFPVRMKCGYVKNKLFIITVLTTIDWVKPAWPAELMFLNLTFLIKILQATPAELASNLINLLKCLF